MNRDDRCIWSNRREPGVRPIEPQPRLGTEMIRVCPEHEEEALAAIEACRRHGPLLLFLAIGSVAGLLAGTALGSTRVAGLAIAALGAGLIALPFVTPQTISLLGLRKSAVLARLTGSILVAIGILQAAGVWD